MLTLISRNAFFVLNKRNSHRNVAHTVSYYKYHRHRFWHIFNLTAFDLLTFMLFYLQSSNKHLNCKRFHENINEKKNENKTKLK